MAFQKIQIGLNTPPVWRTRSKVNFLDFQIKLSLESIFRKNSNWLRYPRILNPAYSLLRKTPSQWTQLVLERVGQWRWSAWAFSSLLYLILASLSLYEFIPNCWEAQNSYGYCCRLSMFLWSPISLHKNSSSIRNHTDLSSSLLYFLNN